MEFKESSEDDPDNGENGVEDSISIKSSSKVGSEGSSPIHNGHLCLTHHACMESEEGSEDNSGNGVKDYSRKCMLRPWAYLIGTCL